MTDLRFALGLLLFLSANLPGKAQETPSFVRQIKPFFSRYCLECHNTDEPNGGLSLESYKTLLEGGTHGSALVAGKPDESRMVQMVEGKAKIVMPPKKARQPKAEEIALLRQWVKGGAKDDTVTTKTTLPAIQPRHLPPSPIAALAYRPDGKLLVAGGQREVILLDPATGEVVGKLPGQSGPVTALAFSRDGRRLAVASGATGAAGEVRLYLADPGALPAAKPLATLAAHRDTIYDLTFSPDGKTLASCGYDRLVRLWDVESGKPRLDLKDHSDAVYGIAFSPDSKLLASGSADRAVKVWDVATGKRLYTLGESTDWVYAVAWSPDGKYLAAAGVDKSIRIWEVSSDGGKIAHSVFAHEGPITRLAYDKDGKTLYSLGEDRRVKAWDSRRMVERTVYPRQSEVALALAVSPDHKQIAIGRYDGVVALLDEATGKTQSEPLPVKPKAPTLNKVTPAAAERGKSVRLKVDGKYLQDATLVTSIPGATVRISPTDKVDQLDATLSIPTTTLAGAYQVHLESSAGKSAALPLLVDLFPLIEATEPGSSPGTGQKIVLPASVVGSIGRAGAVHYYRFTAKAGQQIGVQVLTGSIGSKLDAVLQLTDAEGEVLAEGNDGLLGFNCPRDGTFALGLRDRDYRGDASMTYRLQIGDIPIVTAIYPLGAQRDTETEVHVEGVNLGEVRSVKVKVPSDAAVGSRVAVPLTTSSGSPLGMPTLLVGEFAEVVSPTKEMTIPVPGTGNGRVVKNGDTVTFRFKAKKGQRLLVEVNARRIGSPLDSTLEILDKEGRPLPRATLRCLVRTYTVFRDHDARSPGIRIEAWSELAVDDYLLVGSELVRINALPRNPDDDCQFHSIGGQRLGFLGTTPTFHPQGQPMYKVAIHPPGTKFPPNGLPLVTLYHRNDDGGPGFGKDSRLVFDPPADGEYQVRVGDARGEGGPRHAFRLTIRPARPGYRVSFSPTAPTVSKGAAVPVTVTAERIDEYDGPIEVKLTNLPPGFSAPLSRIPAGENSTSFSLHAEADASVAVKAPALTLSASARIDGKAVTQEVTGAIPKLVEPGDLATTTKQSEVTIKPGGETRVTVTIERRNGFAGRVPVEVRGLPHGVRVLDVGLNGILITEKETTRTFVIHAEPWVEAMTQPFVVFARREGKNTEHAAKSVLLKVVK
jgi:WD40 repeat protein